jgi:hypothetical protein
MSRDIVCECPGRFPLTRSCRYIEIAPRDSLEIKKITTEKWEKKNAKFNPNPLLHRRSPVLHFGVAATTDGEKMRVMIHF